MFWDLCPAGGSSGPVIRTPSLRAGLRPMPRLRADAEDAESVQMSPRCMETRIASTPTTATSALTLVFGNFRHFVDDVGLIMLMVSCVFANTIDTVTYAVKAEAMMAKKPRPLAAVVSNVSKSTLFNRITGCDRLSSRLFRATRALSGR